MLRDIVLASDNAGKLREFEALLAPLNWRVLAQSHFGIDAAPETGLSFVENAIAKARHAARVSGISAIADDSGLEVPALGGEPGIRSARYAGAHGDDEANNQKLLDALRGLGGARRAARFRCVVVALSHALDPAPLIAEGIWYGTLLQAPRGNAGFGYDPLFFDPELGKTAAELDPALKNRHSHRGRAVEKLVRALRDNPALLATGSPGR